MAALPWFAFDRIAYLTNTQHLTTEEHGAYLLLMLTYYGTEKPLPGYDRALASIAKLTLERWLTIKVAIEPFFVVDGSVWRHERIEAELLAASSKHAANVAKATAAAAAKYGKPPKSSAPSIPQASPARTSRKKPPTSQPQASSEDATSKPDASSSSPHLQEHLTLSSERVNAPAATRAPEGQNGLAGQEDQIDIEDVIAKTPDPAVVIPFNPLGTSLPADWTPDDQDQECARSYGMTDMDIESELLLFHARAADKGMFSQNWKAAWQTFCARWKDMQANRRKPRVEVNTTVVTSPRPQDWELALGRWQRDQNGWPRKMLGAEPGQPNCRAPVELLQKYGIDPATGLYRAPATIRETTG